MFSNLALSLLLSCTGPFEPMNGFQIPDIRSAIRAMNQSFSKGGLPCFSSDNVEYSRLINSKKDGETLLYFDLSGDNGYLVFDTEGNLQGFSVLGDLPALREREHVSFAHFEFLMSTALVSAFSGMLDVGAFDVPMQVVMVRVADGYTGEAEAWMI